MGPRVADRSARIAVEIATFDRKSYRLNTYLLHIEQDCNPRTAGCFRATCPRRAPQIEGDWRKLTLNDDEELKNMPFERSEADNALLESAARDGMAKGRYR